jgi:23S rRNA (cytidine1920-2'-O)/16S rRNA (cytidine1409-2'-O)-methyltransferase
MTSPKQRLDIVLVDQGLAESRSKAQALVLAGQVVVNDQRIDKPGTRVSVDSAIRIKGETLKFVSRGGLKLEAALDAFQLSVQGAVCADIGASTGGFTDCLLQRGARKVYALDVGKAQLHEKLRQDARVISSEGVNARNLTEADLPEPVDVMVADVSFISLTKVLPACVKRLKHSGLLIALVKPQFEVGQAQVGKNGVVTDAQARRIAIETVCAHVQGLGLSRVGLIDCPILGPAGNQEALLAARRD